MLSPSGPVTLEPFDLICCTMPLIVPFNLGFGFKQAKNRPPDPARGQGGPHRTSGCKSARRSGAGGGRQRAIDWAWIHWRRRNIVTLGLAACVRFRENLGRIPIPTGQARQLVQNSPETLPEPGSSNNQPMPPEINRARWPQRKHRTPPPKNVPVRCACNCLGPGMACGRTSRSPCPRKRETD
jgi:hypothetical protein